MSGEERRVGDRMLVIKKRIEDSVMVALPLLHCCCN